MPKGDDKLNPLNKDIKQYDQDLNSTIDIFAKPSAPKYTEGIDIKLSEYEEAKKAGAGDLLTPESFLQNKEDFQKIATEKERLLNDSRARQQSLGDKIGNGLVKFGGRVFTSIAGSTIGTLHGLYAWARDGEFKSFYDNEFQDGLDGINDYLSEEFPHYYTSNKNDWEISNFIFDKVFDGLGFAVGAVGSSMLGGGATNALTKSLGWSKYMKAGAVNKLNKTLQSTTASSDDVLKATEKFTRDIRRIDKASKIPHTISSMTTGAVYESGVEARHTFDEIKEDLINSYKLEYGKAPTGQQLEEINKIAGESANGVFAANMAVVGGSNILQFSRHLGLDFSDAKKLFTNKRIATETAEGFTKKGSSTLRGVKQVLSKPIVESQEEMIQSVISGTGKDYAKKKYNNDGKADLTDLLNSSIKSFKKTYSSKEGWEEGLIGAIVGSIGVYNANKVKKGYEGNKLPSLAVIESFKDWRSDENFRNTMVGFLNETDAISSLTSSIQHMLQDGQYEKAKESALILNNVKAYKDTQDEQFHSYVTARIDAGMSDQIYSDLNKLRNIPLEEFKETFSIPAETKYTEVDKLKQIESFERRARDIQESTEFIEKNYPNQEEIHDALIFNHAMLKRISDRKDNISREIEELTGNAAITLNVTNKETGVKATAKEIFKDVDKKYQANKKAYTDLYKDYIDLSEREDKMLTEFVAYTTVPEAAKALIDELDETEQKNAKEANKGKRQKEKTKAKEKQEAKVDSAKAVAKAEEDVLVENQSVVDDIDAAQNEEEYTILDPNLKDALENDKEGRQKIIDEVNKLKKDESGVDPGTPESAKTKLKRDQKINKKSEDSKVAPKDYTKDSKTKKSAEEKIARANRGETTEGFENEEVQKEATGVYRVGKRLVNAFNAIAVRTRNFIDTPSGIKESTDEIKSATSLRILDPKFIKAKDKVEIKLNNDPNFIFYKPDGTVDPDKRNEIGTDNQIMEIYFDEELVGYLHGTDYITERRVVPIVDGADNINRNIEELAKARKEIRKHLQDNPSYSVKVVSKTAGQIRVKANEKYDAKLTDVVQDDTRPELLVIKDGTIYHKDQPLEDSPLADKLVFNPEDVYTLEDSFAEEFNGATMIAVPGANGQYVVSLVRNGSIQEADAKVKDTVLEVLNAYVANDTEALAEFGLADSKTGEVYPELVSEYINNFIYTTSDVDSPHYMFLGLNSKGNPQIRFTHKPGEKPTILEGNTEAPEYKFLEERIDGSLISTNLRSLNDNVQLTLTGGEKISYKDFIYDNLYANFVGEKIPGTNVMSYTDNPIILLDLGNPLDMTSKPKAKKKDRPSEGPLLDSAIDKKKDSKKTVSKDNPLLKSNFKRGKKSPKRDYNPEDLFKSLNPIVDAATGSLVMSQDTIDITMSLTNTVYDIISSEEKISVSEAFKQLEAALVEFRDMYESHGDTAGENAVETVLNNMDSFKLLVSQKLRVLGYNIKGGKMSEIFFESNRQEAFDQAEEETLYGDTPDITKSFNEDAIFTDNPLNKLSAQIKMKLATIPNEEANVLGMDSYYEMETVYNALLETLSDKPDMSISQMIEVLKSKAVEKPYLLYVINNILENPEIDQSVKYAFNSHFKMSYLEKELVKADSENDIRVIESNRVSLTNLIFETWLNRGKLQNLLTASAEGTQVVNKDYVTEVVDPLWETAKETKSVEDTHAYLQAVGIDISLDALREMESNSKNLEGFKRTTWKQLFTHKNRGVFRKIREALDAELPDNVHPFKNEGYIKKIAGVQAKYASDIATKSYRDVEGKSNYSYVLPTWITDRFSRLKNNKGLINKLQKIPFLERSWYLTMLKTDEKFREVFDLKVIDSIKFKGRDGQKFNKLTKKEQLIAQIGFFANSNQGKPGKRIGKFFVSKSDKSNVHVLTALRHNTTSTPEQIRDNKWSEEDKRQILDNIIGSEYSRIKDAQERRDAGVNFGDIKGYNPFIFYTFPELNDLDSIKDEDGNLLDFEDARDTMWKAISQPQEDGTPSTLKQIHTSTKAELEKYGIIENNKLKYVDRVYKGQNRTGNVDYFIRDYTLNYMIATFNYSQLFQSDVAFAAKKNKGVDVAYANMFKRLAKDMAPAVRSATSVSADYNHYNQIVLADAFNSSNNIDQLREMFPDLVPDYSGIEGTDAQEVTLLSEHINVMYHHGKITDEQYNKFYPKAVKGEYYTPAELEELIDIIKNAHKPVYVTNKYMPEYGAEVPVYLKSSSFPLVPQLVEGTAFETLERLMRTNTRKIGNKNMPMPIHRAIFESGAKLGAFKTIDAWNKATNPEGDFITYKDKAITDGTFNEEAIKEALKNNNYLTLDRAGFGIQQDVPFDESKDKIPEGSQLMKLIQTGIEDPTVVEEFNQLHIDITEKAFQNLLDELGATDNGDGTYSGLDLKKLRTLLKEELIDRGSYTENDLVALDIQEDGKGNLQFSTPLWATPKSVQFESLLNSIINKRVIKQKMPGKSYVLATEEGWQGFTSDIERITSGLKGTKYNPKTGLKPQRIGYLNEETNEKQEREYILNLIKKEKDISKLSEEKISELIKTKAKKLGFKEVVFPAQVLMTKGKWNQKQMVGYRIPTQGLNSMSAMEVVGYLPDYMADLIIAPKDFVTQMGSDFDIDKLYVHRWHETRAGRKVSKQSVQTGWEYYLESREKQEFQAESQVKQLAKVTAFLNNTFDKVDLEVSEEDVREIYDKVVTKTLTEEDYKALHEKKQKQNRIMDIYWETLTNKNNLKDVLKPLDFGNLPEVVKNIKASKQHHPLSPIRQINNYQNGNAGKFGVSVTSLASTTNALLQVVKNVITLKTFTGKAYTPVKFKFKVNGEVIEVSDLNGEMTLDGSMKKIDVISAFQSASVDNIKELLIKIINYNKHTHDAFLTLSYLGLDDKYISYLLAQPIIKKYVENREALSGGFTDINVSEIEDEAYRMTFEEFGTTNPVTNWNKAFSEKALITALNNPENLENQQILLEKFKRLSESGKEINDLIRALQPGTSGVGKNRISANLKQAKVEDLLNSQTITGIDEMFGDVERLQNGEINLTPKTIAGQGYEILKRSNNLFNSLFSINSVAMKLAQAVANNNDVNVKGFTEKQLTQLSKFVKSYVFSDKSNMYSDETAVAYRNRLMLGENSLAHRVEKFKQSNPRNPLSLAIRTNISKIEGVPSTVYYNASSAERGDEMKYTIAILQLLNSEVADEVELGEDLIAYTYLTGGNQDAKSLLKLLPNTYLHLVNFGKDVESSSQKIVKGEVEMYPVMKQLFQHFPYLAKSVSLDEAGTLEENGKLIVNTKQPRFISISLDRESKPVVYEKTTEKSIDGIVYKPLNHLGTYEYSETEYNAKDLSSVLAENNVGEDVVVVESQTPPKKDESILDPNVANVAKKVNQTATRYRLGEKNTKAVLDAISNAGISEENKALAKSLASAIGNVPIIQTELPPYADGIYQEENNAILINNNLKDPVEFERVVLHEAMHAVLANVIKNPTTKQQKEIIDSLEAVLKVAQKNESAFSFKNGLKDLDEFISELMTDVTFQRELATLDFNKDINLLQRIWKLISDILSEVTGDVVTQSSIEAVGELIKSTSPTVVSVSESTNELIKEAVSYKDVPIVDSTDIINAEGKKGAAQYDRTNNRILVDRSLLKQKFSEQAWTNPRDLIESIDGVEVTSTMTPMMADQFLSYKQFEDFVIAHEFEHSKYTREMHEALTSDTTKGQYEDEINRRALESLGIPFKPMPKKVTKTEAPVESSPIVLNKEQQAAVDNTVDFIKNGNPNEYYVIEGKAGTGKTTIAEKIAKEFPGQIIKLAALSHKAKGVISKKFSKAKIPATSHSIAGLLGMTLDLSSGKFKVDRNRYTPPPIGEADIIIIDEASMVNEEALEMIMQGKSAKAKVVFLGDIGQLKPIRSVSNPYYKTKKHLLDKKSPVFESTNKSMLTERVRQGEESPILPYADNYWENSQIEKPVLNPTSHKESIYSDKGNLVFANEFSEIEKEVLSKFKEAVKTNNPNLIKIVAYRNNAKASYNKKVHDAVFGKDAAQFNEGEIIIFNDNYKDLKIPNSTEAVVSSVDNKVHKHNRSDIRYRYISVKFGNRTEVIPVVISEDKQKYKDYLNVLAKEKRWPLFYKIKENFADIDYAYAITSHKSQGSTYETVIVDAKDIKGVSKIDNAEKSESIYTALTRASNTAIVLEGGAKATAGTTLYSEESSTPPDLGKVPIFDPETGTQLFSPSRKAAPAVAKVFKDNSELSMLGTATQYQDYLATVFPSSKVPGIVYHGTINKNIPSEGFIGKTMFFTKDHKTAARYAAQKDSAKYDIYLEDFQNGKISENDLSPYVVPALVNITNPFIETSSKTYLENAKTINRISDINDGFVASSVKDTKGIEDQIAVFDSANIHILGSQADVNMFREYLQNENLLNESFDNPSKNSIFKESSTKDVDEHKKQCK